MTSERLFGSIGRAAGAVRLAVLAVGVGLCTLGGVSVGHAAPPGTPSARTAEINAKVAATGALKDASKDLFPAVAAMDPAPVGGSDVRAVSLLTPEASGWAAWASWAEAPAQKAALAALVQVTDPATKHVLGFPYGMTGVDKAWASAGLAVDLGDDGLLAHAPLSARRYLERLDALLCAATVEATRLAAAGDGAGATKMCLSWVRLARMVADRQFAVEVAWGVDRLTQGVERVADLAFLFPAVFTVDVSKQVVDALAPDKLEASRIKFPSGDKSAAMELIGAVIEERGGPRPGVFGLTLSALGAQGPGRGGALDTFRRAAYWGQLEADHAGWFDARERAEAVFGDWEKRWEIDDLFDPIMRDATAYSTLDRRRFAALNVTMDGVQDLFDARTEMYVQIGGLRSAMAVMGFRARQNQWPPNIVSVQPAFIDRLPNDPWNYDPQRELWTIFQYFVPVRDARVAERETPKPHRITVRVKTSADEGEPDAPAEGAPAAAPASGELQIAGLPPEVVAQIRSAFSGGLPPELVDPVSGQFSPAKFRALFEEEVKAAGNLPPEARDQFAQIMKALDDAAITQAFEQVRAWAEASAGPSEVFSVDVDQSRFVLYSVGPNGKAELARSVGLRGTDVLVFPSLLSLERERAAGRGTPTP